MIHISIQQMSYWIRRVVRRSPLSGLGVACGCLEESWSGTHGSVCPPPPRKDPFDVRRSRSGRWECYAESDERADEHHLRSRDAANGDDRDLRGQSRRHPHNSEFQVRKLGDFPLSEGKLTATNLLGSSPWISRFFENIVPSWSGGRRAGRRGARRIAMRRWPDGDYSVFYMI